MIFRLFQRNPRAANVAALYGAIVAQARRPVFYARLGVPDTLEGRFEMVLLHTVLTVRRLRSEDRDAQAEARVLGQGVFDHFVRDMDDTLREMGVGDLTVPKQMQKVGAAFYGRQEAYDAALAQPGDAALTAAVRRHFSLVQVSAMPEVGIAGLTTYIRRTAAQLAAQPVAALMSGTIVFDDPDSVAA